MEKSAKWANILSYPSDYDLVPKETINGVGPMGFGWLFKDWILGVCFTEAANIHDARYYAGEWPRALCDQEFLDNMRRIIEYEKVTGWRRNLLYLYGDGAYMTVRLGGKRSYNG